METLYPIHIPSYEREIIKSIFSGRKNEVPNLWKKITDKNNEIRLTIRENGFMIGALSGQRNTVPECWKQLIDVMNKIKKDAGVEETDLGNGIVQIKDRSGAVIVRPKLDWE